KLPACVEDLKGGRGGDVTVDGGDAVAFDRDIHPAAIPASGVDDFTTFDQQVKFHKESPSYCIGIACFGAETHTVYHAYVSPPNCTSNASASARSRTRPSRRLHSSAVRACSSAAARSPRCSSSAASRTCSVGR